MSKRKWLALVVGVSLLGALGAGLRFGGLASVSGSVSGASAGIKETRVALLQGPEARLLVLMGVVQPGSMLRPEGGNTLEWTSADRAGRFEFSHVRWGEATVVGLTEFEDGRICRTSQHDFDAKLGAHDVSLTIMTSPCWRRQAAASE